MPHPDFEEFIASLDAAGARYLIVGAQAVAHHARARYTKDLDVLVEPRPDNARRVLDAVSSFFGGPTLGYTVEDLTSPTAVLQLGVEPVRIDILMSISGVDNFAKAWKRRSIGRYGPVQEANYIGLDDLIAAKEAAGRPRDLDDLDALLRAKRAIGAKKTPTPRRRRGKR